jgi:hypothetical protein
MPGSYYSDVERTIYLTYYIIMEDISKYDELFQQERKFISFEYFNDYVRHLDYDDLVYGNDALSSLVVKHPGNSPLRLQSSRCHMFALSPCALPSAFAVHVAETKDGLSRFLYSIILRRMEIRDKSRSVNSIDIVWNFDCIGFTGTPFIDNYPTFGYIRNQREDKIPDLIDRSFYVYESEALSVAQFEERFTQFQGENKNVLVEYLPSDFVQGTSNELEILKQIFARTDAEPEAQQRQHGFNVLVDLCGIFKKISIHEVRDMVREHFGPDRFRYIYHIDQADGTDRVLYLNSDNDVQFDEEFYKYLCKQYGAQLREKVFFFIDNRNVIGKDIPFQLVYQRFFGLPLFSKSVVLAHDVEDFSKIWQAMGRSRSMNQTHFTVYKSNALAQEPGVQDIKKLALTRQLYVRNCDLKIAGNLSSIYQTLISLLNLAQDRFYYCDEIINVFLEKLEKTLSTKLKRHEETVESAILHSAVPYGILRHILEDKFLKSANAVVAAALPLAKGTVQQLLRCIVQQKFEQRTSSGDLYDDFIAYLSGEQAGIMEISYTKQQQKQKQKQQNKNQDADTMEVFDKKHQLLLSDETDNYFQYTLTPASDLARNQLNLPISFPIFKLAYMLDGRRHYLSVYPTVQFLYSHHFRPEYITEPVRDAVSAMASAVKSDDPKTVCQSFLTTVRRAKEKGSVGFGWGSKSAVNRFVPQPVGRLLCSAVCDVMPRRVPQYTRGSILAG